MQQLDERLKGQYASLSPQEQRVADFIFDHFDDLISYNSAELAQLSGVSKATVSRLFKRLGYDKYKDNIAGRQSAAAARASSAGSGADMWKSSVTRRSWCSSFLSFLVYQTWD